tara:strand:+ start:1488 stop:1631 length:144 start_codon:yes stop_codon:yes gene_type:complete
MYDSSFEQEMPRQNTNTKIIYLNISNTKYIANRHKQESAQKSSLKLV